MIARPREAHVFIGDSQGILEERPLDHPPKLLLVAADVNTLGEVQRDSRSIGVVRDEP
jgi:hypothetical protein